MSASIKDWSHSQILPLAFTITASLSPGENIYPSLPPPLTFQQPLCYVFSFTSFGRLFRPTFAEIDNLITMDIVNN